VVPVKSLGKRNVLGILVDAVDYEYVVNAVMLAAEEGRSLAVSALAVHGVMTGSDSNRSWVVAMYLSCIGVVAALTAWRATAPPAAAKRRRLADMEA